MDFGKRSYHNNMKWYGITGSWRQTSTEVEQDVRKIVREVIERGDGIVSGGALNVDYFATDEALRAGATGHQLRIIIPSSLDQYARHYRTRAEEGVITNEQAEDLITQLNEVRDKNGLIEMNHTEMNIDTYFDRNTAVVEASDELLAFQVNDSQGVQDTIDKASRVNKSVTLKKYTL